MWECKHCSKKFEGLNPNQKANHSRWCDLNPKKQFYIDNTKKAVSAMLKSQDREQHRLTIIEYHKKGLYDGIAEKSIKTKTKNGTLKLSEETKEKIRKKALASKHRRVLRKTQKYTKPDGIVILLDSSWEVALATRLDILDIKWERPEPLQWKDQDDIIHNYFPDFYLVEQKEYLEVKNPYLLKLQKEKMEALLKKYPNIKILKTLKECKNFNIGLQ